MKIVLDTNVLVSSLLSPFGPPAEIVRLVAVENLIICYDARILSEYREVLRRPKFAFDPVLIETFLDGIEASGELVAPYLLPFPLPDRDDEPFLEATLSGKAACLITGNIRHYPPPKRAEAYVASPKEFLDYYRKHRLRLK